MSAAPLRIYIIGAIGPVEGRVERCAKGKAVWRELVRLGFAPCAQHFFTATEPGADALATYQQWLAIDAEWLDVSDAALWDRALCPDPSSGGDLEVQRAERLRIPVFHSIADLVAWRDTVPADPVAPLRATLRAGERAFRLACDSGKYGDDALDVFARTLGDLRVELRQAERAKKKAAEAVR
jgi:hypothetical protein